MQHQTFEGLPDGVSVIASTFEGAAGCAETHLAVQTRGLASYELELAAVLAAYRTATESLGLSADSAVFRRVFLSDAANQGERLEASELFCGAPGEGPVAVSVIEQPPQPEGRVALWAYHISDPAGLQKEATPAGMLLTRGALCHVHTTALRHPYPGQEPSSFGQTRWLFERYLEGIEALGGTLAVDVIRTWVYVHDVDAQYAGMVRARRELFAAHGLTPDTHYITSTGIEGRGRDARQKVVMDAYAVCGISPRQLRFIEAPENLPPTHVYGVTFERGVRVDWADRFHLYLAGTASIDPAGLTLYPRDVARQVERALDNIALLLRKGGASLEDVAQLVVYVRDSADRRVVEAAVRRRLPQTPMVLVRAPVCRPDWLVEVEAIAIGANDAPEFPAF